MNYWTRLYNWKTLHDAMHPITNAITQETCYTWSSPVRWISHSIIVRDLGGFNLTYYAKPVR